MIEVFYYSIAGKKTNSTIDSIVETFISCDYIPAQDKKILKHIATVAENGNYPSADYFKTFYEKPQIQYKSIAEILTYSKTVVDFYKTQHIQKELIKAINDSTDSKTLVSKVESVVLETDTKEVADDLDEYKPTLYSSEKGKPSTKGITLGIPEVDAETNGFQLGNIVSVCGFTGHGKSTLVNSMLFKNVLEGRKCVLVSLELAPALVWLMIQARYLYEVKGLQVTTTDLIQRRLTSEMEKKVESFDADFKNDICSNLLIVDESYFNKQTLLNYKLLAKKFKNIEENLSGLDVIAWDHVGQLELLFPECGNIIIKQIQSFTKTYLTKTGSNIVTVFAVQCNREGEKRAKRREGVYDLQAIADLNEIERSSSYIVFMYTSDDMKIIQETKITLHKNRLGSPITEPVVTTFNPAVCMVGSSVEKISVDESDFSSFGDISFDDDAF